MTSTMSDAKFGHPHRKPDVTHVGLRLAFYAFVVAVCALHAATPTTASAANKPVASATAGGTPADLGWPRTLSAIHKLRSAAARFVDGFR